MRKSTDLCLLCGINEATKKESHIISKFMTKAMIMQDKKRVAYVINTGQMDKKIHTKQDTPKDDYILCPNCEAYFGLLETIYTSCVQRSLRDEKSEYFIEYETDNDWIIKESTNIDPHITYLLVYSIFWRCDISNHGVFADFKMPIKECDLIKKTLLEYISTKKDTLLSSLSNAKETFVYFQNIIFTVKSLEYVSEGAVAYYPSVNNLSTIYAGEYIITMFFDKVENESTYVLLNNLNQNSRIILLDYSTWKQMSNEILKLAILYTEANLKSRGVKYRGLD